MVLGVLEAALLNNDALSKKRLDQAVLCHSRLIKERGEVVDWSLEDGIFYEDELVIFEDVRSVRCTKGRGTCLHCVKGIPHMPYKATRALVNHIDSQLTTPPFCLLRPQGTRRYIGLPLVEGDSPIPTNTLDYCESDEYDDVVILCSLQTNVNIAGCSCTGTFMSYSAELDTSNCVLFKPEDFCLEPPYIKGHELVATTKDGPLRLNVSLPGNRCECLPIFLGHGADVRVATPSTCKNPGRVLLFAISVRVFFNENKLVATALSKETTQQLCAIQTAIYGNCGEGREVSVNSVFDVRDWSCFGSGNALRERPNLRYKLWLPRFVTYYCTGRDSEHENAAMGSSETRRLMGENSSSGFKLKRMCEGNGALRRLWSDQVAPTEVEHYDVMTTKHLDLMFRVCFVSLCAFSRRVGTSARWINGCPLGRHLRSFWDSAALTEGIMVERAREQAGLTEEKEPLFERWKAKFLRHEKNVDLDDETFHGGSLRGVFVLLRDMSKKKYVPLDKRSVHLQDSARRLQALYYSRDTEEGSTDDKPDLSPMGGCSVDAVENWKSKDLCVNSYAYGAVGCAPGEAVPLDTALRMHWFAGFGLPSSYVSSRCTPGGSVQIERTTSKYVGKGTDKSLHSITTLCGVRGERMGNSSFDLGEELRGSYTNASDWAMAFSVPFLAAALEQEPLLQGIDKEEWLGASRRRDLVRFVSRNVPIFCMLLQGRDSQCGWDSSSTFHRGGTFRRNHIVQYPRGQMFLWESALHAVLRHESMSCIGHGHVCLKGAKNGRLSCTFYAGELLAASKSRLDRALGYSYLMRGANSGDVRSASLLCNIWIAFARKGQLGCLNEVMPFHDTYMTDVLKMFFLCPDPEALDFVTEMLIMKTEEPAVKGGEKQPLFMTVCNKIFKDEDTKVTLTFRRNFSFLKRICAIIRFNLAQVGNPMQPLFILPATAKHGGASTWLTEELHSLSSRASEVLTEFASRNRGHLARMKATEVKVKSSDELLTKCGLQLHLNALGNRVMSVSVMKEMCFRLLDAMSTHLRRMLVYGDTCVDSFMTLKNEKNKRIREQRIECNTLRKTTLKLRGDLAVSRSRERCLERLRKNDKSLNILVTRQEEIGEGSKEISRLKRELVQQESAFKMRLKEVVRAERVSGSNALKMETRRMGSIINSQRAEIRALQGIDHRVTKNPPPVLAKPPSKERKVRAKLTKKEKPVLGSKKNRQLRGELNVVKCELRLKGQVVASLQKDLERVREELKLSTKTAMELVCENHRSAASIQKNVAVLFQ